MELSVLASGSSGNSTYIGSDETSILVDAGISAREIVRRLSAIGKDACEIKAVFITHEHSDHIKGAEKFSRKFSIPVYISKPTFDASSLELDRPEFIWQEKKINLMDIMVTPFSISHDAVDPFAFEIQNKGSKIGVMTDFGKANERIKKVISSSDSMVLEANHDLEMLIHGPYPYHLKERILGEKGHISNIDAGLLVKENGTEKLKSVFLAHLSKKNNTEELAYDTFSAITGKNKDLKINKIMAKQEENTEIIKV